MRMRRGLGESYWCNQSCDYISKLLFDGSFMRSECVYVFQYEFNSEQIFTCVPRVWDVRLLEVTVLCLFLVLLTIRNGF